MNIKAYLKYFVVVALVVVLGSLSLGTAHAETYTATDVRGNTAIVTTASATSTSGQATTTLSVVIINPQTPPTGSVLGASTVGLPSTGAGGGAIAIWSSVGLFVALCAMLAMMYRRLA